MKEKKFDRFRPRIFIDKEGRWFQDGIPVLHKWTYLYNNRHLRRDKKGRYYIEEGMGRIYAIVEDTPFIVKMIDKRTDGFYLILNDETEEKLELNNLKMSKENIPYTKVKGGEFDARFTRQAYYELTKFLRHDNGKFYLELDDNKHYLEQK
ncbi:MAG: hypothetical protein ACE5H1_02530 [Thermodesulfobacteriota bacterium]